MAKKKIEQLPAPTVTKLNPLTAKIRQKELEYLKDYAAIPKHYVNNTLVTTSLYDVKLVFGQVVNANGNKLLVDPEVIVFMSPQHAKAIALMLDKQIKAYEERNGPIPASDDA